MHHNEAAQPERVATARGFVVSLGWHLWPLFTGVTDCNSPPSVRDARTGDWRTIPEADEIVVAVQAQDDPNLAEVFGFAPEVLIRAFNGSAAKILAKNLENRPHRSSSRSTINSMIRTSCPRI
jgi:hypothetical protein